MTKTEAIVLRTVKYGDNKLIADLFTREGGRLSFITRCATRGRGSVRRQLFQPLAMLIVEGDISRGDHLKKLRTVAIDSPYTTIPTTVEKTVLCLFIAEFLCYALRDEQKNEALYDWIAGSIRWLDACKGSCANFHIVFTSRISQFLGFYPNMCHYEEGNVFDLRAGCFTADIPGHSDYLCAEEAARMRTVMRMTYRNMHLFRMSKEARNRLLDIILHYYSLHIPSFPQMKSTGVLRELFG